MTASSRPYLSIWPVLLLPLHLASFLPTRLVLCQSTNFTFETFTSTNQLLLRDLASLDTNSSSILLNYNNHSYGCGKLIFSDTVRMRDAPNESAPVVASFSTSFTFSMSGTNSAGFAFMIATENYTVGTAYQGGGGASMCLLNKTQNGAVANHLFAIEFDTWQNPEFNDSSNNHVGVNVNSMNSTMSYNLCAGQTCSYFVTGNDFTSWIDYNGVNKTLEVRLANGSTIQGVAKPSNALIQVPQLDLSTVVNDYMYVGFSGSTGEDVEVHEIKSWRFESSALKETPTKSSHVSMFAGVSAAGATIVLAGLAGLILYIRRRECRVQLSPNSTSGLVPDDKFQQNLLWLFCCHPNPAAKPDMQSAEQYIASELPLSTLPASKPSYRGVIDHEFSETVVRQMTVSAHPHEPIFAAHPSQDSVEINPRMLVENYDVTATGHPDEANNWRMHSLSAAPVKFCRHHYEVLVPHLRRTNALLGHFDERMPSDPVFDYTKLQCFPMQAKSQLELVITHARGLINECCSDLSLLKAALRQAHWSQGFAYIVTEIIWYTSVVNYHKTINWNVEKSSVEQLEGTSRRAILEYGSEQFMLEKVVEDDWQDVMVELENWNQGHLCSVEVCGNMHQEAGDLSYCVAHQILQRWKEAKSGVVSGDEASSSAKADHQSLLWRFDKEVLTYHQPLGSGAFGSVHKVSWLGDKYAQKSFNVTGSRSSFQAEVGALAKLNHSHIVKVFAYSEDSFLMDLMCTDLQKYISSRMDEGARQPFSLSAAIDLMLQVADAMSYLHSKRMAHRDLKSGNILVNPVNTPSLCEEGFVFAKVADFGLAKTKREVTNYSHLTHNTGTRQWTAPEIFGANEQDNHLPHAFPMKADVYSFGIVCFEILSGEPPYKNVKVSELCKELTAPVPLRPVLPSTCPKNLASLIHSCWNGDPRRRPSFVDVSSMLRLFKGLLMTDTNL